MSLSGAFKLNGDAHVWNPCAVGRTTRPPNGAASIEIKLVFILPMPDHRVW